MESLVFVALTPIALILMGVVGLVSWRRRDVPGGWGLTAFTAMSATWVLLDALALLARTPETTVRLVQATAMFASLLCVAWIGFVLSYTERFSAVARRVIALLVAWSVVYGMLSWTNDAHHLVWEAWQVIPEGSLSRVSYTLGPVGWAQTAFAYTSITVSLGVILWVYAGTGARARDLSRWIVAGAFAPMTLSVLYLFGVGPLEKDFTSLSMALSSAAFAVGLARYRFLDLRPIARAALVDNLLEGMVVLDTEGRVADANPALHALGVKAEIGRPLRETAPWLAAAIASASDETLRLGTGSAARYVDLRVSPLTDGTGSPSGCLVLLYDVTRRREERAALHRANAELYDANAELQARNDELDAFAHTVAHDLKNSIQGITGWAEILRDDGPALSPREHHDIASGVVSMSQKMGTVVHELLLLAGVRQSAVEPQPVEMGQVVREALERLQRAQVQLAVAGSPSAWPLAVGHAPWIEEIWVNYLSNAAKYGGAAVTLGADTHGGTARFWVHDDGPGLSPEAQQRLFVPFSRVGALSVEGHGLGLSIVRRITERLGGTCGVESAPGRGTQFWFALPLAVPVGERVAGYEPSASAA